MKIIFFDTTYHEINGEHMWTGDVEYEADVANSKGEDWFVRIHDTPIGWGVAVPKDKEGKWYTIKSED